jgi:drug/metabolite transporter (DMT)-like permease
MKESVSISVPLTRSGETAKGVSLMLGAAFLFAILGLLFKLLGPEFRVWDIAMYRFGGGVIVLQALFGWKQNLFKPQNPKMMLVRGITGSITFLTLILAIRLLPLSTAMVFFYSFPAFAAVFSPLLFGNRISIADAMCIAISLIGVVILFDFKFAGGIFGQMMALLAAVFAGLTMALIKELSETHGSVIIYFYFCLIGTVICIGPFSVNPQLPRVAWEWLIVGGIVFTSTTSQLMMTQGLRYCTSWEGGVFMTSELVFVSIIGILILSEPVSWRFWLGGLLILASAVMFNLLKGRKNSQNRYD